MIKTINLEWQRIALQLLPLGISFEEIAKMMGAGRSAFRSHTGITDVRAKFPHRPNPRQIDHVRQAVKGKLTALAHDESAQAQQMRDLLMRWLAAHANDPVPVTRRRNTDTIVRVFFGRLGMGLRQIARATGVDYSTLRKRLKALGGEAAFPHRPQTARERFDMQLGAYRKELEDKEIEGMDREWVSDILARHLSRPRLPRGELQAIFTNDEEKSK